MTWQLVRLADVAAAPWRNGGGVTRELAASTGGADWTWRISVAEVAAGGPFSRFDGVQRWFAVLSGRGVVLRLGGAEHRIADGSAPFEFDGAMPLDCQLIDGATQDLNLMVRRHLAGGRMLRLSGERQFAVGAGSTCALYAMEGPVRVRDELGLMDVPAHSLAWRAVPAAAQVEVAAAAAFWMEIEPWA